MDSDSTAKPGNPAATSTPVRLSVCICTYNGGARLPAVFECLIRQTAPREQWEILVVNNASKDDTASVAADLLRQPGLPEGRIAPEPEQGITFARRRAAIEARGEIVCFLDDDNLPNPDYVATALRIFAEHPKTGSVGGKIKAEWEVEPTPLVRAVEQYALAIVDMGEEPRVFTWVAQGPVCAGMCIRRDMLLAALGDVELCRAVPGRKGSRLTSGEDEVLAVKVYQAGYERRYDPSLCMRHRLNSKRMTREYLLRLYDGIGRGQTAVRRLWAPRGHLRSVVFLVGLKCFFMWLRGKISGPTEKKWLTHFPESICAQYPELRSDLHALEQSLIWGRMSAALEYVFSKPKRGS